jgi:hypothetical protein
VPAALGAQAPPTEDAPPRRGPRRSARIRAAGAAGGAALLVLLLLWRPWAPPRYTTAELARLYARGAAAADARLAGRTVEVTGHVVGGADRSVVLEVAARPLMAGMGTNPDELRDRALLAGARGADAPLSFIDCRLSPGAAAGRVKDGQLVTIRGTYKGRDPSGHLATMEGCTVVGP